MIVLHELSNILHRTVRFQPVFQTSKQSIIFLPSWSNYSVSKPSCAIAANFDTSILRSARWPAPQRHLYGDTLSFSNA